MFAKLFTSPGQVYGRNFSAVRTGLTLGVGVGVGAGVAHVATGNVALRKIHPEHKITMTPLAAMDKSLTTVSGLRVVQNGLNARLEALEKKEAGKKEADAGDDLLGKANKSGKKGEKGESATA